MALNSFSRYLRDGKSLELVEASLDSLITEYRVEVLASKRPEWQRKWADCAVGTLFRQGFELLVASSQENAGLEKEFLSS